ncbi:MAG: preprotein translocase subunit SecE [Candidatus Cloacimonadota bacterium]|nr:preprotein translocase subunit SecE [Candidatus Cloacimonadota bacterium]
MFKKTIKFFKEVKQELRHVAWPSMVDLKEGTYVVLSFSVLFGVFIWLVDNIFTQILGFVLFK